MEALIKFELSLPCINLLSFRSSILLLIRELLALMQFFMELLIHQVRDWNHH
jgi:hypothetical protein